MNTHGGSQSAEGREATARAPMGELKCAIASHGSVPTWFAVRPHAESVPRYEQLGLILEPGCRVVVEANSPRPAGVRGPDKPVPSATGFNPYFDLPPA
jgi:hypothetical protein